MKTLKILFVAIALIIVPAFALAQTSPAGSYDSSKVATTTPVPAPAPVTPPSTIPTDWTNALTGFIVGGVPVLVMLLKKVLPPSVSNFIPLIATMLGPAVAFMASRAVDHSISPLAATLLGLGSVGLRELLVHLTRAVAERP
jgi:hypothetical protein